MKTEIIKGFYNGNEKYIIDFIPGAKWNSTKDLREGTLHDNNSHYWTLVDSNLIDEDDIDFCYDIINLGDKSLIGLRDVNLDNTEFQFATEEDKFNQLEYLKNISFIWYSKKSLTIHQVSKIKDVISLDNVICDSIYLYDLFGDPMIGFDSNENFSLLTNYYDPTDKFSMKFIIDKNYKVWKEAVKEVTNVLYDSNEKVNITWKCDIPKDLFELKDKKESEIISNIQIASKYANNFMKQFD